MDRNKKESDKVSTESKLNGGDIEMTPRPSQAWLVSQFDFIVKFAAAVAVLGAALVGISQFINWPRVWSLLIPSDLTFLEVRHCRYTFFNSDLPQDTLPGSDPDASPYIDLKGDDDPVSLAAFDAPEGCRSKPDGTVSVSIASTKVCGGITNIWFDDEKGRIYIPMADKSCHAHRSAVDVQYLLLPQ